MDAVSGDGIHVHVFVYGSLMTGLGNHRLLARSEKVRDDVTVDRFGMVDMGGFPAVVDDESSGTEVVGELYSADADTMATLDRLEGYPRFYTRRTVALRGGNRAWMYLLNDERMRNGAASVPDCDWRAHLTERRARTGA